MILSKCVKEGFDNLDIEEFEEHLKELAQEKVIQKNPIPKKHRSKSINVDFEKIRINKVLNRVIQKEGENK